MDMKTRETKKIDITRISILLEYNYFLGKHSRLSLPV